MFGFILVKNSLIFRDANAHRRIKWVKKHLGKAAYKRLILSHHKNLNVGDFFIDDRTKNGADKFKGEHIHFGTEKFPNWEAVVRYLKLKV